jgi:hypothetical protein
MNRIPRTRRVTAALAVLADRARTARRKTALPAT